MAYKPRGRTCVQFCPAELRAELARVGWTQRELAERVGVTTSAVEKWAVGYVRPALVHVRKMRRLGLRFAATPGEGGR